MKNKLPRIEAAGDPRLTRQTAIFMFGLAALALCLLLILFSLASYQNNPPGWPVVAGWLIFSAWPAGNGLAHWRRYHQALELESTYLVLPGQVVDLMHQEIGGPDSAPVTDVYWVIFICSGGEAVKQKVSPDTWQKMEIGAAIQVRVSPRSRRICRAELE